MTTTRYLSGAQLDQLAAGTYKDESRKKWADVRQEYDDKMLPRLKPKTQRVVASTSTSKGGLNCHP